MVPQVIHKFLIIAQWHVEQGNQFLIAPIGTRQTLANDCSDVLPAKLSIHELRVNDVPITFSSIYHFNI